MAKSIYPNFPYTFSQAAQMLAGKDSIKIAHNTWLEYRHDTLYSPALVIGVRLHNTYIVTFYSSFLDEVERIGFCTGGWASAITANRMHAIATFCGYRVNRQGGYLWLTDKANEKDCTIIPARNDLLVINKLAEGTL